MLIIFFDIKRNVHKEFVLADKTVNSSYYCDLLRRLHENVRRLRSELWGQKIRLFHHNSVSHFLFHQGISFSKNNTANVPHPSYVSLFPRLEIELKGRHFDTIEVTEAESHAVLNIFREHGFQDTFKNGRSAGNGAYAQKGTTSRVMVTSRTKDSF
jgi:hypothetical protein